MVANDAELVGRLREGLRPERFPGKGIRDIIVQDVDYNGSADHTQILQFLILTLLFACSAIFRGANQNRPLNGYHGGTARGGTHAQHIYARQSCARGGTLCIYVCMYV
jgi:hypothetical protein